MRTRRKRALAHFIASARVYASCTRLSLVRTQLCTDLYENLAGDQLLSKAGANLNVHTELKIGTFFKTGTDLKAGTHIKVHTDFKVGSNFQAGSVY